MLLILKELRNLLRSHTYFTHEGRQLEYFAHPYNNTRANERCIEVPIIKSYYDHHQPKDILEVGNVLKHYYPLTHDVLDKYETAPGVINEDVTAFQPKKRFSLIVSISTFEHVGWDEYPRDPHKVERTIKHLVSLLKKNGQLIFTVPLGFNHDLDNLIRANVIGFTNQYFFKRVTSTNIWLQQDMRILNGAKYNYPFPAANEVMIGIITKGS